MFRPNFPSAGYRKEEKNRKKIKDKTAGRDDTDDTASMIKGGGYLDARTRQPCWLYFSSLFGFQLLAFCSYFPSYFPSHFLFSKAFPLLSS